MPRPPRRAATELHALSEAAEHPDVARPRVALVIPCYRVRDHIRDVLAGIGREVSDIFVVDDCCPQRSGDMVESRVRDPRVRILRTPRNLGVGGAVMLGYQAALDAHADIIVKLDGDGQMDPALIPRFIAPIASGQADYAKGNRFFNLDGVRNMPLARRIGNLGLSFFTKLACGYWHIFDPTNGYTAIHAAAARSLPLERISRRYFFESDMLFHLNLIRAVVDDVPIAARYGRERSGLNAFTAMPRFLLGNLRNFARRVWCNYFLRDFNIASIELALGTAMLVFGTGFGITHWIRSDQTGVTASAGTVMLAALPTILGVQMLLSFLNFDTAQRPATPMHRRPG